MKISIDIDNEKIKGLLCSGFEGGINYWAQIDGYRYAKGLKHSDFQEGGKFQIQGNYWHPCQIIPLVEDCAVIIMDTEQVKRHTLNLKAIHKGLDVMCKEYPKHFGDFLSDNGDATTGDVFIQCCLFGKIVYG